MLDIYAQLEQKPGCSLHFKFSTDPASLPAATPFAPEIQAMIDRSLVEVFRTHAGLFRDRCVAAPGDASPSGGGIMSYRPLSFELFQGLGDAATYSDVEVMTYARSNTLTVVSGDSLLTLTLTGHPTLSADNRRAFAAEVALAQRILGEPGVPLDVEISSVDPPPPLPSAPAPGPTAPPGVAAVDKERFDAIEGDMTYEEIVGLVGFEPTERSARQQEDHYWEAGPRGVARLEFYDGIYRGSKYVLPGTDGELVAKIARVQPGTAIADAHAILGPPRNVEAFLYESYTWRDDSGRRIKVEFRDGAYSGKTWAGDGP